MILMNSISVERRGAATCRIGLMRKTAIINWICILILLLGVSPGLAEEGGDTEEKTVPPTVKEENFDDDPAYYLSAEVMPEPKGGIAELQKKLIYPSYAKENEIEGTVKVRAFVDQNGDVTRAEVEQGIGYGCDESARITVLYAKFNPGLIRGKPIKTQVVIPLEFKLPKKD